MMVTLAPLGSKLPRAMYTEHDISQIGLRLAWMHRLLKEELPELPTEAPLADRLRRVMDGGVVQRDQIGPLMEILGMSAGQGWVHGDMRLPALLVDSDHQLRTITDWGLLHVGSPLEDVVDVFMSVCTDGQGRLVQARGRALLEAYGSLLAIERTPWTPVVASWCAQRILDAAARRRELPEGFERLLRWPERLATALAGCVGGREA
jgi:hypothetical protein